MVCGSGGSINTSSLTMLESQDIAIPMICASPRNEDHTQWVLERMMQPAESGKHSPANFTNLYYSAPRGIRAPLIERCRALLDRETTFAMTAGLDLLHKLQNNPDCTRAQAMEIVKRIPQQHSGESDEPSIGSDWEYLKDTMFPRIIDEYFRCVQQVRDLRGRFDNPNEIFRCLYGYLPQGQITLRNSPCCIVLVVTNALDFARAYGYKHATLAQAQSLTSTTGFYKRESSPPIMVVRATDDRQEADHIYAHEMKHAMHDMIWRSSGSPPEIQNLLELYISSIRSAKSLQEAEIHIRGYLQSYRRHYADERLGDELLAYLIDYQTTPRSTYMRLSTKKKDEGLYDYTFKHRSDTASILSNALPRSVEPEIQKSQEHVYQLMDQVWVDEYRKLIMRAMNAILRLRAVYVLDSEIFSLFSGNSIHHWERISIRYVSTHRMSKEDFSLRNHGCRVVYRKPGESGLCLGRFIRLKADPEIVFVKDDETNEEFRYPIHELQEVNYPYRSFQEWMEIFSIEVTEHIEKLLSDLGDTVLSPHEVWKLMRQNHIHTHHKARSIFLLFARHITDSHFSHIRMNDKERLVMT